MKKDNEGIKIQVQVVNYYRCPWCGKGFGSEEEDKFNDHPRMCAYFNYLIEKLKIK
jgi:hypothetical protein